ncbi:FAD-binding protein, partial [Pseudomonas oryzihabitans]|uniref:FAD-binding protein n=1 Tax=Pseudomonas oryzihabitans TaxID=47885 RepID=UPI002B1DD23B
MRHASRRRAVCLETKRPMVVGHQSGALFRAVSPIGALRSIPDHLDRILLAQGICYRQARPVMPSLDIIIAGAGMGGLTAALALGQAGHRVRLCERAQD